MKNVHVESVKRLGQDWQRIGVWAALDLALGADAAFVGRWKRSRSWEIVELQEGLKIQVGRVAKGDVPIYGRAGNPGQIQIRRRGVVQQV